MTTSQPNTVASERVLILTPTGGDGLLVAEVLRKHGFVGEVCRNLTELCLMAEEGAGAIFVAEEAILPVGYDFLISRLQEQPKWSDLPVIVMTYKPSDSLLDEAMSERMKLVGTVSFFERPLRILQFINVIRTSLRARQRQYELQALIKATKDQVDQRDTFLAMLGHELRNPLAAIVTANTILTQFARRESSLFDSECRVIERQSSHMRRLVDDILDVARITSGRVILNPQIIDLRECMSRALETTRTAMGSQKHDITMQTAAHPVSVNGDPMRLEQVFVNLLTNAIKYTPAGGKISVSVDGHDAAEACVTVKDTGDGIAPEMRSKLFEPFTQAVQSLARSRGGLGMGLSIVKGLVELHGGKVVVNSEGVGKGSEFVVTLPCVQNPAPAASAPDEASVQSLRCSVLIVEDNDDARNTLARLVRMWGHDVTEARDGPSGLAKALAGGIDIVLLDIGLPGMDGYEVAKQIRLKMPKHPVIFAMTGYGQPQDKDRSAASGVNSHFVKPVELDALKTLIDKQNCHSR